MSDQFRISVTTLGLLAMPDVCPRCFWVKLRASRLPYQIFPGIFSSIDSYSKKVTAVSYLGDLAPLNWFRDMGLYGKPVNVPGYTRYRILDEGTRIELRGVPDEIFQLEDGSFAILDYKTSKFSAAQNRLHPRYEAQLNAYSYIGERVGYSPVSRIMLVYYQPETDLALEDLEDQLLIDGFRMNFSAHPLEVTLKPELIPELLGRARAIYDTHGPPEGIVGCRDCQALEEIIVLLSSLSMK